MLRYWKMIKIIKFLLVILFCLPLFCYALIFPLPSQDNDVVGQEHDAFVNSYDDLTAVSQRNDVGSFELKEANLHNDLSHLYVGEHLLVPTKYILPSQLRRGIVVNLAERRLYYYPVGQHVVMTFPVGIGRAGKDSETPLINTKIVEKIKNPKWFPSASTRAEARAQGIVLPRFVEAGPDNPLGNFAMRLGLPEYLIHGTQDPTGVGIRSSAGCLRMYPADVRQLFSSVKIGTPVQIINEPYKVGFNGRTLELEAHVPLNQKQGSPMTAESIAQLNRVLMPVVEKYHAEVHWDRALAVAKAQTGVPEMIGYR